MRCVSDSTLFSFVVTYHVALGCLPLFCSKRRAMAATNFLLFFFLSFFSFFFFPVFFFLEETRF